MERQISCFVYQTAVGGSSILLTGVFICIICHWVLGNLDRPRATFSYLGEGSREVLDEALVIYISLFICIGSDTSL